MEQTFKVLISLPNDGLNGVMDVRDKLTESFPSQAIKVIGPFERNNGRVECAATVSHSSRTKFFDCIRMLGGYAAADSITEDDLG